MLNMFFLWFLPLFLMQAIHANLCLASEASIIVPQEVKIEHNEILLGEIAVIESRDPWLEKELRSIIIGKAPLPGKSRLIGKDYLEMRLRQKDLDLSSLRLQAPEEIEISRGSVEVSPARLRKIVQAYLHKSLPWEKNRVRIKDIRVCSKVILPKGRISYDVTPPKNSNLLGAVPLCG